MKEKTLRGILNRLLQHLARVMPGAASVRVALHRARGVSIGKNTWIGYDVILDTSCPEFVSIGDDCTISMRVTIIAHFRELRGVTLENGVFVGPGVVILPNVVVGEGSVVTAGSVVTRSVPPMTVVQGNPAVPVARCGISLSPDVTMKEFSRKLTPLVSHDIAQKRSA
jgi:acetyltransferase-like isoleucine patch superfamily enzyme